MIHKDAIIGENCIIRQNVTIAGATQKGITGAPIIGDNVELNAGCVIVGPIRIGSNARIGANAVVNKDIPDNCTAVGMPAEPIKYHDPATFHIGV